MAHQKIEQRREGPEAMRPLPIGADLDAVAETAPARSSYLLAGTDRSADGWDGRGLDRLASVVSRAIAQFSPRSVPHGQWSRIADLVRDSAEKAAPASAYRAGHLMTVATELALWIDKIGLPLEAGVVFHPDHIDRFILEACAHLAVGTQSNYRTQLRVIGALVLGAERFPLTPLPIPRVEPLKPYSATDIALLRSWGRGLPTESFRRGVAAILAFGLGTGITSAELTHLVGTDVAVVGDCALVRVTGRRRREVPVLRHWANEVADLATAAGTGPVFAPRTRVANFIAVCPDGDAPTLNPTRLRNTWIVGHISAGTHFVSLTEAAGVAPEAIARLARYAIAPDEGVAHRMLRGAGVP